MREILFRGKRKDNGEWLWGDLLQDRDLGICLIEGFDYYTDADGLQRDYFQHEVIPETVGQYAGLTDKNGEKIFEGDIVNCITSDFDGSDKYVYNFKITNITDYEQMGFLDFCHAIEIIGNIYGNPITEANDDER